MNLSVMGALRLTFHESGLVFRDKDTWAANVPGPLDSAWTDTSALPTSMAALRADLLASLVSGIHGLLALGQRRAYRALPGQDYRCGVIGAGVTARAVALVDAGTRQVTTLAVIALAVDLRSNALEGGADDFMGMLPASLVSGHVIAVRGAPVLCLYRDLEHLYLESVYARAADPAPARGGAAIAQLWGVLGALERLQTLAICGLGVFDGAAPEERMLRLPDLDLAQSLLTGAALHPGARLAVLALCRAGVTADHMGDVAAMGAAWMPALRALSVAGNPGIGDAGAVALLSVCMRRPVHTLSLQRCGLTGALGDNMFAALAGRALGALDLSCNALADAGFWTALGAFNTERNTGHLHTLDLSYTGVRTHHITKMFEARGSTAPTIGRLRIVACDNAHFYDTSALARHVAAITGKPLVDPAVEPIRNIAAWRNAYSTWAAACIVFRDTVASLHAAGSASWLQTWPMLDACTAVADWSNGVLEYINRQTSADLLMPIAAKLTAARTSVALMLPEWMRLPSEMESTRTHAIHHANAVIVVAPWTTGRPQMTFPSALTGAIVTQRQPRPEIGYPSALAIVLAHVPVREHIGAALAVSRRFVDVLCRADEISAAMAANVHSLRVFADQYVAPPPPAPAATRTALVLTSAAAAHQNTLRTFMDQQEDALRAFMEQMGQIGNEPALARSAALAVPVPLPGADVSGDVIMSGERTPAPSRRYTVGPSSTTVTSTTVTSTTVTTRPPAPPAAPALVPPPAVIRRPANAARFGGAADAPKLNINVSGMGNVKIVTGTRRAPYVAPRDVEFPASTTPPPQLLVQAPPPPLLLQAPPPPPVQQAEAQAWDEFFMEVAQEAQQQQQVQEQQVQTAQAGESYLDIENLLSDENPFEPSAVVRRQAQASSASSAALFPQSLLDDWAIEFGPLQGAPVATATTAPPAEAAAEAAATPPPPAEAATNYDLVGAQEEQPTVFDAMVAAAFADVITQYDIPPQ